MKRAIVIVLSLLCVVGVVYLGYVIFRAKNVESIEIVGDIQTLYVANECVEPDFQDAELKVTYKNGSVKMIKLTNDIVTVPSFSTSVADHKTMKIIYKSQELEVDYDVINNGLFYVNKTTFVDVDDAVNPTPTTYNATSSPMMFYIGQDGELEYYYRENGEVYMHDGSYDKSYKYVISGGVMKIYLGGEEPAYKLTSNYNPEGTASLKSVTTTVTDLGIVASKETKVYSFYENFKTDRRISAVSLNFEKTSNVIKDASDYQNSIVIFHVHDTIKSSGETILLKVSYINDYFMKDVYVYVSDEMIVGSSFVTNETSEVGHMYCVYDKQDFTVAYKVDNN